MQKDDIMFGKIGNISETSTETHALDRVSGQEI